MLRGVGRAVDTALAPGTAFRGIASADYRSMNGQPGRVTGPRLIGRTMGSRT
jgi:hypothetical protein